MKRKPLFAIGDPLSYGMLDGRQVPCTVAQSDPQTGLPSALTVRETIPHLCKQGARITLDPSFWEDFKR